MKQLLLIPYILALVTAAPYDIVVKLGEKDQASAAPSGTSANSSATALQAPSASSAWTMFNTTLSTLAQTVQTNPPALAPAYGPVASPVPAPAYTVPGSAPGPAPAFAQAYGALSAVNLSSSASGGAPVPAYDPASAVAPANNTYYSSPTATTQPAANSNNNNNNNDIVSYPSSSTNYNNSALTSVQQPSLLYNNTPSAPAAAPSSSVSTSPADSTGSPLVAPVSTPLETNITISFTNTSYSASAPAPPPSPISYTYVNQTPPYMKEAASPGALTDNSPLPPQVPPAPSVYPAPVPSPALSPSPVFSPDSTHKTDNTTSTPSLSPDSSANPSSTAEALFPVLNNSLIVVRLPPENVTSQDNGNGAPSQLSQNINSAQRPSAHLSTVTNNVSTLNGSALPGSAPSGLRPAASDSTNSVTTNIQPHNRTADIVNNLLQIPAAVSELIGSHVASAKNDKVDASSTHDKTSTKPTYLHIQIAPLASSSDSSNTSKSKDNSTASTMTSSSASVTEQKQHNVQVSPKSANASKGILDSSVSTSAVVQLGLQATKPPLSVHHISPPAKATPPKQKEGAAGKWGFGDKYLASQNQRARHRNVMFDGIAGDPSSFSNYQVLGHQDLLFKRSAEREKRHEEATATEEPSL